MSSPPLQIFISYAREDLRFKERLLEHLHVLKGQHAITCWSDSLVEPGLPWDPNIVGQLKSSRIILLLVSPSFVKSDYINRVELQLAAEQYLTGAVRVVPVLVRALSNWETYPFGQQKLGDLGALPGNGQCITRWKKSDEAYKNIVDGIARIVESLKLNPESSPDSASSDAPSAYIPRPPSLGFIKRFGRDGRNILQQLKEELSPERNQVVVLSGSGGVGKSTLATEAARALLKVFSGRVVWLDAVSLTPFTLSTLINEIAIRLGRRDIHGLVPELKQEELRRMVTNPPALIVIDNFESVSPEEQNRCLDLFLNGAFCPVLITTAFTINRLDVCDIPLEAMQLDEAREFMKRLTKRTPKHVLPDELHDLIIFVTYGNPLLMGLIVKQITFGIDPSTAMSSLITGEGIEHIFDRSFNLVQVGDDGRTVLLALANFVPDASRPALADVAGFANDLPRLNKAIKKLAAAWLMQTTKEGERLKLRGLTRDFARQRLSSHDRAESFRQRYVAYFLNYGEGHRKQEQSTPEELKALDSDRGNLMHAMEVAYSLRDWASVVRLMEVLHYNVFRGLLPQRGYWEEALRLNELADKAAQELIDGATAEESREAYIRAKIQLAQNAAYIHQVCGDLDEARQLYDRALKIAETNRNPDAIADINHEKGKFEQELGNIREAREFYRLSLKIKKSRRNRVGIAITLHELGRLEQDQGNWAEAKDLLTQSQELLKELGADEDIISANNWHELGRLAHDQGQIEEARWNYHLSLNIKRRLGDQRGIAITLHEQGRLAQDREELEEAERLYEESKKIQENLPDPSGIANNWHELGRLAHRRGAVIKAREGFNKSLAIKEVFGFRRGMAITYHELGRLALEQGNLREAHHFFARSLRIQKRLGDKKGIATTLYQGGLLAEAERDLIRAARRLLKSVKLFRELNSPQLTMAVHRLEEIIGPH